MNTLPFMPDQEGVVTKTGHGVSNPVTRIENTAKALASQAWHVEAIEKMIHHAFCGPFQSAGLYWAKVWGVSRRTADRLIHQLIDSGLFRVEDEGGWKKPRRLSLVRGFQIGEQSSDAHKVVKEDSQVLKNTYYSNNSLWVLDNFLGEEMGHPLQNEVIFVQGSTIQLKTKRAFKPKETQVKASITRRVGDIWSKHPRWAQDRSKEWDSKLAAFEPWVVSTVLDDLVQRGAPLPTLPQLVSLCEYEAMPRRGPPPRKQNIAPIVYVDKLAGAEADFNALGAWKEATKQMRKEDHLSFDLWLSMLDVEISQGTLWLDISSQGSDSRQVLHGLLMDGKVVYDKVGRLLSVMESPFTLAVIQNKLGGVSIGIKTRRHSRGGSVGSY